MKRMTDERVAEIEAILYEDTDNVDELLQALKAEREHNAELEAELAKAKLSNAGMHKTIERLTDRIAELEAENNELQAWVDGYREHGTRVLNANKEEIDTLKAKLDARCNHSELLHEITELSRHNTVLQKADMHREKIWKKRVAELEANIKQVLGELTVLTDWIHRGFSADDAATEIKAIVERESGEAK